MSVDLLMNTLVNNTAATAKSITITLEDVTFNYARVGAPVKAPFAGPMDAPTWSVQAVATKGTEAYDTLMDLAASGAAVFYTDDADKDNSPIAINLKQYTRNAAGDPQTIGVFDANVEPMSDADRAKVGDGSKGAVIFYAYDHGRKDVDTVLATRLTNVIIDELVEFTPTSGVDALRAKRAAKAAQ